MPYGLLTVRNFSLKGSDGEIGLCDDFLFDDRDWSVRYMVALLGIRLPGRKVLIPHNVLGHPDPRNSTFTINLTTAAIKQVEPLVEQPPVSRQRHRDSAGPFLVPSGRVPCDEPYAWFSCTALKEADARHLRSAVEVSRYRVQAFDGLLGYVDEFLVDNLNEEIRYLVVDTGHWLSGKKVIVPPERIISVSWEDRRIKLNCNKDVIRNQPSFEPVFFGGSSEGR